MRKTKNQISTDNGVLTGFYLSISYEILTTLESSAFGRIARYNVLSTGI
jgi:hypothetical protein